VETSIAAAYARPRSERASQLSERCDIVSCRKSHYVVQTMATRFAKPGLLDRMAMGLSGLCLVHCLATAVLLGVVASIGGFLGQPIFHEVGLGLAMMLGAFALGRGLLNHGFFLPAAVGVLGLSLMAIAISVGEGGIERLYTVSGVAILALAHRLNILAGE
jgi:hypothetical protein